MNCKKSKKLIVVYSELNNAEKLQLAAHLENCSSCSALLISTQEQMSAVVSAKNWNPEIENPVAFTDSIMAALPPRSFATAKSKNKLFSAFYWTPLQTALAACSLILAMTFIIEFNQVEAYTKSQPSVKNGITLSIDQEKLIQAKRTRIKRFSLEKIINQDINTIAFSK